ncbi:MAG: pentapeptide repeat-containing protein [Caldilineaceae bacterium]
MLWFIFSLSILFAWAIYGLYALDLHRSVLETINLPLAKWLVQPGNSVRVALWLGAIVITAISWFSPPESLLGRMLTDFISISIAVIVIDELVQYRNALQEKHRIIEQMGSAVNDVALEAVRLAWKHKWLTDGTLRGAYLSEANLKGAVLWTGDFAGVDFWDANLSATNLGRANLTNSRLCDANLNQSDLISANLSGADLGYASFENANLEYANLYGANLEGTNLWGAKLAFANLEAAKYTQDTIWPENFDPKAKGAIKIAPDDRSDRRLLNIANR